jgi:RNA-directed DNA polymerase
MKDRAPAGDRRKVKAITNRQAADRDPMVVILELNRITRGWADYFRTGASKRAFGNVDR